jgi:hypothetical protein
MRQKHNLSQQLIDVILGMVALEPHQRISLGTALNVLAPKSELIGTPLPCASLLL